MANRVNAILTKVLRKLNQMGEHSITRDDLLADMEAIQLELCRKYLALKNAGNLSLIAGTSTYALSAIYGSSVYADSFFSSLDSTVYKFREIIAPSTWLKPFEIIHDSLEWNKRKNATYSDTTQPQYGFIWNGTLYVTPTPTVTEDLLYYAYGLPNFTLGIIEDLDNSVSGDPLTGPEWDDCYENELFFRNGGPDKFHMLYETRARELSNENFKESVAGIVRVQHSSDDLGF